MKIGIIGAIPQEIEILLNKMQNLNIINYANIKINCGNIAGHEIFLIQSGIGKTLAASGTTSLLNYAKLDLIINTGSAGGLVADMTMGDIVLSTEVVYHDVDVSAFGYKKGQMAGCPETFKADQKLLALIKQNIDTHGYKIYQGLIASGDIFLNGNNQLQQIKHDFPLAIAVDMEATAIGHVCYEYQVPFIVIRAISDVADQQSHLSFDEFLPLAAKKSSQLIIQILEKLH